MEEDKDFSMFVKSGQVLNCFFQRCIFPFESIREERENKTKDLPFYLYDEYCEYLKDVILALSCGAQILTQIECQ